MKNDIMISPNRLQFSIRRFALVNILIFSWLFNFAQNEKTTAVNISFPPSTSELNFEQKFFIDQLYDRIPCGTQVSINVLSENEKKHGQKTCNMNLSKSRCGLVYDYLLEKNIDPKDIQQKIIPFDKKDRKNSTNASYRDFVYSQGIYSIMVYKSSNNPASFTNGEGPNLDSAIMQEFKIDPCYESNILGNQRTTVVFPENAFYTDCSLASCQELTVQLWEYYQISEIIEAGLTTTSNGKILETGGMIYIRVLCNGKEIKLRKEKKVKIIMPTEYNKKFEVFNGNIRQEIVNWKIDEKEKVENLETEGGGDFEEGYWTEEERILGSIMESSSLGWINLDLFYENENIQDLFVQVEKITEKTTVLMVFHDMKSILPGGFFNPLKAVKFGGIPRGKEVTIIAFHKDGNEMLAGTTTTTVGLSRTENINLERISQADFKKLILGFN